MQDTRCMQFKIVVLTRILKKSRYAQKNYQDERTYWKDWSQKSLNREEVVLQWDYHG